MATRPGSEAHVGFHDVSHFEAWIFDFAGHEIFFQILLVQVLADKDLGKRLTVPNDPTNHRLLDLVSTLLLKQIALKVPTRMTNYCISGYFL